MEGTVYPAAFGRHDIEQRVPTPEDRTLVDRVIFAELTQGRLEDRSRAAFVRIIAGMRAIGCDAVALSCTEIPLLITPEVSPLPTLDSTRLLAWEAVAAALDDLVPEWRGGTVAGGARARK
jgi:aspartate racemase